MSFKRNYEKICFEKRLKPSAVCNAIGLSYSTYTLWTETSVPRKSTLKKLADYLGVTEEELLRDDSQKPDAISNITVGDNNIINNGNNITNNIRKSTAPKGDASDEKRTYLLNIFMNCDEEGRDRMIREAEKILLDRLKNK